jgi:hypothetical protein
MRHSIALSLTLLFVASVGWLGHAASPEVQDLSAGHNLGFGLSLTAPFATPNTFPASGFSSRLWIANLFGFEASIFVVDGAPSFAARSFIKFINTSLVDLYVGTGAAFFGSEGKLVVPLQAMSGIEIRLSEHIAINAELGLLFRGVSGVTAGFSADFYL